MKKSSVEVELRTIQETVLEIMSVSEPSVPEIDNKGNKEHFIPRDAQK